MGSRAGVDMVAKIKITPLLGAEPRSSSPYPVYFIVLLSIHGEPG
jgi:hypothetical protein